MRQCLMKNVIELHYGKSRIQCFTHTHKYGQYMVMPEQPLKDMLKDTNLITKNKTTTEQIIFMKSLTLNCELGRIMIIYHECFTINQ